VAQEENALAVTSCILVPAARWCYLSHVRSFLPPEHIEYKHVLSIFLIERTHKQVCILHDIGAVCIESL